MGKLSILGAQRVKALIDMLNSVEKERIEEVRQTLPSQDEIKRIVDKEFEIEELRRKALELQLELTDTYEQINEVTGEKKYIQICNHYSSHKKNEHTKRVEELQRAKEEEIAKIKKEFDKKRNELWLCETLEDAKAIVGI